MAYTFFRNLGAEHVNYTAIRSIVIDSLGTESKFDFSMDTLQIVGRYFPLLQNAAELIGDGDFKGLEKRISS